MYKRQLVFYDDLTEGGFISARAVQRIPWSRSHREHLARSVARCFELMPKARAEAEPVVWPVWAAFVNTPAPAIMADLSPEFDRVCLCATHADRGPFLALPLRGYLGWRRRARLAGYA